MHEIGDGNVPAEGHKFEEGVTQTWGLTLVHWPWLQKGSPVGHARVVKISFDALQIWKVILSIVL